jgi:indolepyruvate ferredoxin oxidoreductase beta subunit
MPALIKDPLNIIICGVGGQGNILASELLAAALVEKGFNTTVGETYGVSQRGGSVMSHVRVSSLHQYGVLIPRGEADIIIGFEPIETLRVAREYGNKSTRIIFDTRPNYPLGVLVGEALYPDMESIQQELKLLCGEVEIVAATRLAQEAGNAQAANILLMGALTALPSVPLSAADYEQVLKQRFQGEVYNTNKQVFSLGYSLVSR